MTIGECALCGHYDSEHDRNSPRRCNTRHCDDQVNDAGEVIAHHCNPCECPGNESPDDTTGEC